MNKKNDQDYIFTDAERKEFLSNHTQNEKYYKGLKSTLGNLEYACNIILNLCDEQALNEMESRTQKIFEEARSILDKHRKAAATGPAGVRH